MSKTTIWELWKLEEGILQFEMCLFKEKVLLNLCMNFEVHNNFTWECLPPPSSVAHWPWAPSSLLAMTSNMFLCSMENSMHCIKEELSQLHICRKSHHQRNPIFHYWSKQATDQQKFSKRFLEIQKISLALK